MIEQVVERHNAATVVNAAGIGHPAPSSSPADRSVIAALSVKVTTEAPDLPVAALAACRDHRGRQPSAPDGFSRRRFERRLSSFGEVWLSPQ